MAEPNEDEDLKALARRASEYARSAGNSPQVRKDFERLAEIVWEYIVLIEAEVEEKPTVTEILGRTRH